jgi:hypothetical protein
MINMAKMIWLFNIRSPGSEKLDMSMDSAFTDGIIVAPKKFPVEFVPRSSQHARTIRTEFETSREFLARYE